MKLINTLLFCAAICLASCAGNKTSEAEADSNLDSEQQTIVDANRSAHEVIALENDTILRPGMIPSRPTVIDFNAVWCGPCRAFKPIFHEAAPKFADVDFISCDIDEMPQTAQAFGIRTVPTVIFINTDGHTTQYIGTEDLMPAEKFENLIRSLFNQ